MNHSSFLDPVVSFNHKCVQVRHPSWFFRPSSRSGDVHKTGTSRLLNCFFLLGALGVFMPKPAEAQDLVVTAMTDPPAVATPGGSFAVTDTVQNQGLVTAGSSTTRFYLSADTVRNSGDLLLTGSRGVLSLAPAASSTARGGLRRRR